MINERLRDMFPRPSTMKDHALHDQPLDSARVLSKIAFRASPAPQAQEAQQLLRAQYGDVSEQEADVIVALGGDGLMLQCLHRQLGSNVPIYGMNRGSVGFLMNEYRSDALLERLAAAERSIIHPLIMETTDVHGVVTKAHALNEVSLLRRSYQAAKLEISVDGRARLPELIADGVLVATPAGSTAYNLSANGPIVPLNAPLLVLTPLSPFRPRRWRGALLPEKAHIAIRVLEADRRPVNAAADHLEIADVSEVKIEMDRKISLTMLHDPGHSLEERILNEQFWV